MRSFLALSRSTHGVLDIAMPGFAALLWLGHFPRWPVLLVALLTALAGYTALYALNDIIGVKVDREKFAGAGPNAGYSVEASDLRYPIAQGKLSLGKGIAWFAAWYVIALIGAYWLNPLLIWVVLAAPVLETVYCLLFKVSWWRVLVSGVVKALGPVAAVLAVVPRPDPALLGLMVAWLMAWEIGGQNIPADWNDVEEDRRVGARTIPLVFGPKIAGTVVLIALLATLALGWFLPLMSPLALGLRFQLGMLAIGVVLLLAPGFQLFRSHEGRRAAKLFDRASLYPLALLALVTVFVLID
ncbi:UbiA family prenyltransferase [Thermomonas sp.]|uniref:UbiA family prenyltransferase n=1 Tax=Thermomonas sp. TaxID=1971895 RepID=UPI00260DE9EE|nr:UbiA family prenyltransferase [Thermomonas sp.]MCO5054814.1 UbiA family prenyltransferase [Thermomonas sp.]HRO63630.1 UbiA family prenyltransferase [Thermomonas sp.]